MELKQYQMDAIYDESDGLLENTLDFLKSSKHQRLIVLKSIMGSGKTIIASEYIKAILESDNPIRKNKDICIIWLSKGNAGLHMQSSDKLKQFIKSKDIHIYGIKDSSDFNANRFYDKDVYVINWEKINNLKDGELVNNLFVDSENKNLRLAIRNSKDMEYIFIIDEFHMNYDTDSYKKIIEFFDPHVIIGMSATPSDKQLVGADRKYIIPVSDVMNEGMIKKGICFNTASDYTEDEITQYDTIDEFFLRLALRQRDILETKYRKEGSNIIPLLLIQFNDDKSNEEIKGVKEILDREYNNNKNGTYAIWISETDNKKDKLRSSDNIIKNLNNNNIRVLLFKQAVATGWDCPRAHVLLRYRRIATKKDNKAVSSFDVQTIGRIFRMPEPDRFETTDYKHYLDDDLNYGYVFVPTNSYQLEKDFNTAFGETGNSVPKTVYTVDYGTDESEENIDKKDILVETITNNTEINLSSSPNAIKNTKLPKSNKIAIYTEEENALIRKAQKLLSEYNYCATDRKPTNIEINKEIKEIIGDIDTSKIHNSGYKGGITFQGKTLKISDAILDNSEVEISDTGISISINDTPSVLNSKADKALRELIDRKQYPKDTKDYFKREIKRFFRKEIAGFDAIDEKSILETSKLILLNLSIIKEIIRDVDDAIREMSSYLFKRTDFSFPTDFKVPPDFKNDCKGLSHIVLPSKASEPEKIFANYLDDPDNEVFLWYKNPDKGEKAFCVKYNINEIIRGKKKRIETPTYPDFIVIFKNGNVGIYEIKDYDKEDSKDDQKNIAIKELAEKINNEQNEIKVFGSLLYIDQVSKTIKDIDKHPELN